MSDTTLDLIGLVILLLVVVVAAGVFVGERE